MNNYNYIGKLIEILEKSFRALCELCGAKNPERSTKND